MKHCRAWSALVAAVALSFVGLSSSQASPVRVESPHILAPLPPGTGAPSPSRLLASPVAPMRVSRLYDPPPERWNPGHRGVDLASAVGTDVRSPSAGTVTFAGIVVNRPLVTVTFGSGMRSSVEPVDPLAVVGSVVQRGEVIGKVADTATAQHCSSEVCVHWGLRVGEDYVNPLDWVEGFGPIRLLPLG